MFLTNLSATAEGFDAREFGSFEPAASELEPAAGLPRVYLPKPPEEMRLQMDQSPVPSRSEGIVFGTVYVYRQHRPSMVRYGMPSSATFRFVRDDRWPPLTDWNPAVIDWPAVPAMPPEMKAILPAGLPEAVIEMDGAGGPVVGNGRFHFSADYRW